MGTQTGVLTRCESTQRLFQMVFEAQGPGVWSARRVLVPRSEPPQSSGPSSPPSPPQLAGQFLIAPDYPGCPYCRATSFWRCQACGNANCWTGASAVTCAWCHLAGFITGSIDHLSAAGGGAGVLATAPPRPRVQSTPPARQLAPPRRPPTRS